MSEPCTPSVAEMPRSGAHKFGEGPTFTRTFRVELCNTNFTFAQIVTLCGVTFGSPHPEHAAAVVNDLEVSEAIEEQEVAPDEDGPPGESSPPQSRFFVTVVAKYAVPEQEQASTTPLERGDTWKFSTQGVAVPALYFFDGNTIKPLTNSAGDYFEGLMVDEAQQKITITANRASFPSSIAAAITNCTNASAYLGFAPGHVKVQGISGELVSEVVDDVTWWYWKVTVELLARQTGWDLLIPDVGFNFLEGGEKRRAYVKGPDGDNVATANPVALNGAGGMQAAGNLPAVLTRQIYRRVNFEAYFGS